MKISPTQHQNHSLQKSAHTSEHRTAFFQDLLNQTKESQSQTLATSYNSWRSEYETRGLSFEVAQNIQTLSDDYLNILNKAVQEGGYQDPQKFLSTLATQELEVIQKINVLADPIDPKSVTKEGALNLLLPRDKPQDLDNDGITMSGISRGWQFPPVNAPQDVHDAWDTVTKGMSVEEELMAQANFFTLTPESNILPDATSYVHMLEERLAGLEYFKTQTPKEQYERQKSLFTAFLNALKGSY